MTFYGMMHRGACVESLFLPHVAQQPPFPPISIWLLAGFNGLYHDNDLLRSVPLHAFPWPCRRSGSSLTLVPLLRLCQPPLLAKAAV